MMEMSWSAGEKLFDYDMYFTGEAIDLVSPLLLFFFFYMKKLSDFELFFMFVIIGLFCAVKPNSRFFAHYFKVVFMLKNIFKISEVKALILPKFSIIFSMLKWLSFCKTHMSICGVSINRFDK